MQEQMLPVMVAPGSENQQVFFNDVIEPTKGNATLAFFLLNNHKNHSP